MPKAFYYLLMGGGFVLGVILAIENMIGASSSGYILIWMTEIYNVILFAILCGIFIGYGFSQITKSETDISDETF